MLSVWWNFCAQQFLFLGSPPSQPCHSHKMHLRQHLVHCHYWIASTMSLVLLGVCLRSVFKKWATQRPNVSTRLFYLSASSDQRQTSLLSSSSGTSMIRRSIWIRLLISRCSEWVHTQGHRSVSQFESAWKICFVVVFSAEREELWQHPKGAGCIREDEIGRFILVLLEYYKIH